MKMRCIILFTGLLPAFIISCNNETGKKQLMPEIQLADSTAVMFYNIPDNPRFFKYTKVFDLKKMEKVIKDVNGKVIKEKPGCATQGKLYFYSGKEIVYVVYFSDKDSCMTFSFIITGEKYFVRMSEEARLLLNELRSHAKEPVSVN